MTRLLPALLIGALLIPVGVEAQRSSGSSDASSELGPEARVFLGAMEAIRDLALESPGDSTLWEKAIEGLINELDDPYAQVLSPDEVRAFEEQSTGNYAGIGVQITELNEAVTITAVFRNTPADNAGLQVGDRIVGVDLDTAESWSVSDASGRIRGEPGTVVTVTVERDGMPQPIPHEITREEVHIPAVTSERIFDDLGYVLLDRVARNSAAEVDSVLAGLDGVNGLILDLRRNPGGYLDESLNLADLFLDRGSVLVTTRSRSRGSQGQLREDSARARMAPRMTDVPIVVLVDQFSASAAEIVAGALQDHDRALVLGERTFGKGSVQSVVPLPEGRLIRLTSGEWYTPIGRSLNRPRDRDGRVIESSSIPEFSSEGGRTLLGGGGVFPDLEVTADSLSESEQAFVSETVEAEIPLTLRIQEVSFRAAQETRSAGTPAGDFEFPDDVFDAFLASLVDEGLDEADFTTEIQDYLRWRLEVSYFRRLEMERRALEVQSSRDSVLSTAVRFLRSAGSQEELFALAAAENATRDEAASVDVGGQ